MMEAIMTELQMSSDDVYNRITKISEASGMSKTRLLTNAMKPYLVAAYDPYKRYYKTTCHPGQGTLCFTNDTWALLDALSTKVLSGQAAQYEIDTHTKQLTANSAELFRRILNKDLRIGLAAKSINKHFKNLIPTHDVMLAKLFDYKKVKYPCWGSIKIDGVRAIFKNGKFYSRGGHEYVGLEHISALIPESATLDGELYIPNETFQVSSGRIRSDNPTPDAVYAVFDIPVTNTVPFQERLGTLVQLIHEIYDTHDIPIKSDRPPYRYPIELVTHELLRDEFEVHYYHVRCVANKHEGAVIKSYDYKYVGTRSWHWMKMKTTLTVDTRALDIFEGEGKYEGMLGGVVIAYKNSLVKVGSGFSDTQRKEFWDNPSLIMYRMIEVAYMEETDAGSLRHPRFITLRPDKEKEGL